MGRSTHDFTASLYSRSERSTRRRDAINGDILEFLTKGKWGLYHCNYCNKDISKHIHVKCAMCSDFDLCLECFSVGAEISPHRSDHPYRVIVEEELSFPLICPDWNAHDEMLLLEGLEVYGLENWPEVAEHVGTKSKEQCRDHYNDVYLNSPDFLPDMSHLEGKSRDDILSWEKCQNKETKDIDCAVPIDIPRVAAAAVKKASKVGQVKDDSPSVGDCTRKHGQRRKQKPSCIERRKNRSSCDERRKKFLSSDEGSSSPWPDGYNPLRHEFEIEYDDDAEKMLNDMDFYKSDTKDEHELKLRVLHIYSKRVDERNRRKDFLRERNLLQPSPFEQSLSPEERAICRRYDIFMRLHSKEEHDNLLQIVIREHQMRKRLAELKEARAAGCRTTTEADRYLEHRTNLMVERSSDRATARAAPPFSPGSAGEQSNSRSVGYMHTGRVPPAELLTEAEKQLCVECNLHPAVYLKIQEIISKEIFKGNVTKESDTHHLLRIDPRTLERIYGMLVKKGIAPP